MKSTAWPVIILRVLRRLYRLLLHPIYLISGFLPRAPNLWVFGARNGETFEGNSKWLYLYVARQQPDVRAIWISRSPVIVNMLRSSGFEAHFMYSLHGLWFQFRACVFLFNLNSPDINYWASRGAFRVNLQHGTPFKRFGCDVVNPANPLFYNHHGNQLKRFAIRLGSPSSFECVDLVVSASSTASERWASAMGIERDCIVETGYPRNDVLLANNYSPRVWDCHWYNKLSTARAIGKRIIAYLPTFRYEDKADKSQPIDWEQLNALLIDSDRILWYRKHPSDVSVAPAVNVCSNIYFLPDDIDLDPLLRITDLLVTDYSSLYFDFLLLDRPIIFYAYDLKQYLAGGLNLYDCYEDITPGPIVTDFNELLACIERDGDVEEWSAARAQLLLQQHKYRDASSCQRAYSVISERMIANNPNVSNTE